MVVGSIHRRQCSAATIVGHEQPILLRHVLALDSQRDYFRVGERSQLELRTSKVETGAQPCCVAYHRALDGFFRRRVVTENLGTIGRIDKLQVSWSGFNVGTLCLFGALVYCVG